MGSKHFDEAFLKDWFKQMQKTSKSGKISEQVSKLFELPDVNKKVESKESVDDSVNVSGDLDAKAKEDSKTDQDGDRGSELLESKSEDATSQTIFVTELCSVILTKLLAAHSEYESRFGSCESKTPKIENAEDGSGKNRSGGWVRGSSVLVDTIKDLTEELAANFGDDILTSEIKKLLGKKGWKIESVSSKDKSASSSSQSKTEICANAEATVPSADESSSDLTALFKAGDVPGKLSAELGIPSDDTNNNASELESQSQFSIVETLPDTHRYRLTTFLPQNPKSFVKTVQKEVALLRESLPAGIFVRGFEDRMVRELCKAQILVQT